MRQILVYIMLGILLAFIIITVANIETAADEPLEDVYIGIPFEVDEPAPELDKPQETRTLLGTFTVTAYCPCSICCGKWSNPQDPRTKSGTRTVQGRTVGADWNTIAQGTVVEIEGLGERTVEDKPADWIIKKYDGKVLDLYFDSHQEAWNFGKRQLEVWEVNKQ